MNTKYLLFTLIIGGLLLQTSSAFTLSEVNISPSYDVLPGAPITAYLVLHPSPINGYTSDPNNTIQIITGLDNVVFTRQTILDGQMSVQIVNEKTLILPGWDIAYKLSAGQVIHEQFNITITGIAPSVPSTGEVTIISIAEFNPLGIKIPSSEQLFQKLVISPGDLQSGIYLANKDLETLRKNIDGIHKIGIDTSGAEAIYGDTSNVLALVKSYPPNQYPLALTRLKEVSASISRADTLLNHGWAQVEINNATGSLDKLDREIINLSKSGFTLIDKTSPLNAILANRTSASKEIAAARDAMQINDFNTARLQAAKGKTLADGAYQDAITLQKRMSDPLTILWENRFIAVIILAGIVLIVLFKPKKRRPKKQKTEVKKDGITLP